MKLSLAELKLYNLGQGVVRGPLMPMENSFLPTLRETSLLSSSLAPLPLGAVIRTNSSLWSMSGSDVYHFWAHTHHIHLCSPFLFNCWKLDVVTLPGPRRWQETLTQGRGTRWKELESQNYSVEQSHLEYPHWIVSWAENKLPYSCH